jgi:hypothetical protein
MLDMIGMFILHASVISLSLFLFKRVCACACTHLWLDPRKEGLQSYPQVDCQWASLNATRRGATRPPWWPVCVCMYVCVSVGV